MDNPVWEANRAVLQRRWPEILHELINTDPGHFEAELVEGRDATLAINGLQLGSRHDPMAEARDLAADIGQSPRVHCYGSGLGHLPRAALESPHLRELQVHVLNPALFALTLQVVEQQDWLADSRIDLVLTNGAGTAQAPFLTLPVEMQLACDAALPMVQALEAELTREFTESRFSSDNTQWRERLTRNRSIVSSDADARVLFGRHAGSLALVTGAGPTLEHALPRISAMRHDQPDMVLIAVDTALNTLLNASLMPDYVVSIDPLIETRHVDGVGETAPDLVYFPLVPGETLKAWPGERYVAVSASPLFDVLGADKPTACLFSGGSVIHPAVDLAVSVGCEQVILAGTDFGYPNQRTHAGWADGELGPSVQTATSCTLDGHGQRIPSDTNFNNYRVELERYIELHPDVCFFNTSLDGARIRGTALHPDFVR